MMYQAILSPIQETAAGNRKKKVASVVGIREESHEAAFPRATAVHEDIRRPRSRRPREAAGHEDWAPLITSRNDLS